MPLPDHLLGFGQCEKLLARQTLVTKPAVEALYVAILPRTARLNVGSPDIDALQEAADSMADELRAVVASNEFRQTADRKHVD